MCSILQTIQEGFAFVGTAQAAAEIKNSVVIIQGQLAQKFFQFLKGYPILQNGS